MESLNKKQWHIFTVFCAVVGLVLVARLMVMTPLFADSALQQRAGAIIQATVAREGWLASGLSLEHVSAEGAVLLYTAHQRGSDITQCHTLSFATGRLEPCPR